MSEAKLEYDSTAMRILVEVYAEDVELLNRYYDIPFSQQDLDGKRSFYADYQAQLGKIGFDGLSQSERIDYLLLKNRLTYELRKLDTDEARNCEATELVPFAQVVVDLEQQRRALGPVDASELASRVTKLAEQIKQTQGSVSEENAGGKVQAYRAASMIADLQRVFKRWYEFYNGYDPAFTWWLSEPSGKAEKAMGEYATFLREEIVGIKKDEQETPVFGEPIGRDALLNELSNAMIPYTPEELIAIGQKEFDWCKNEMQRASHELGYGDDWHQALEYIKKAHVAPGEQPHVIQELAIEAIEYLEEHDLVTIPPLARQMWRMNMMSPERQKQTPFFTGGEVISVSFPTNTMPHDQKLMSLRGNNIHFARATVHHEVIPGHHLQGFMARRYQQHRRVFGTPFFLEGWALHWEMLLWDRGFARNAENRVGMLFWRMHRCARIIFSLRFHLGEMTPQECIDMLVNEVGHEKANATAEVRRSIEGSYGPLYQCAYMLGGLQIRALYGELVASGRMTHRQYHDALLRENSIPVELIRASLTEQELDEDFVPKWRFAG